MKKVAVDARPLSRPRSGIRRYLEKILETLLENTQTEWYLYSDQPLLSDIIKSHHNVVVRVAGTGMLAKIVWNWQLPRWIKNDSPDTYWSPRHHLPRGLSREITKVVTIHDLVWVTLPETMRMSSLLAEKLLTPYSIKAADVIIAVSESTATDIRALSPESGPKITVLHHGRSNLSSQIKGLKDSQKRDPFFLSVGTIEPRKNFGLLLQAYAEYLAAGGTHDLVIVGNRGWGWGAFEKQRSILGLGDKFRFVENCDDTELALLYKYCKAFVMVSLGEGYGLPVAEAEEFGQPMLLSDLAVFREIQPARAIWVDQSNKSEITAALIELSKLEPNFSTITLKSQLNDKWSDIANKVYELL